MKTEEKAKKVQNIATALAAIFGAVGAFFGIFQAQVSADLKKSGDQSAKRLAANHCKCHLYLGR